MKHLEYIFNLTRFAFRANPLLYFSIIISVFSVAVELLAMSSLLPLFEIISSGKILSTGVIARGLTYLGFAINANTFFGTFIVLLVIRIVTQLLAQSLSVYLGRRVMAQIGAQAFEKIVQSISVRDIGEKSIGYFISLAGDESFRASILVISLTQFIATACLACFYYVAIASYSIKTAIFVLVFLLCSLMALGGVFRASHRLGRRQFDESRKIHTIFLDALNNLKAVRSFSAEKYVVGLYRTMIFGYTKTLFWIDEMSLISRLGPVLLLLAVLSFWFVFSATRVEDIGLVFIVTISAYLMRFFPVVGQGVNLLMKIISDAKAGQDVTKMIDLKRVDILTVSTFLQKVHKIELQDLGFSYEQGSDKFVLQALNYKFEKGKSYAISGTSGIGKSTLIDILLKFYEPSSGHVYFDGTSITEISASSLRRHVVLVGQDSAIFDDTVINNICLGMDVTLSEIQAACKEALIHDVIELMDDQYDTRLQYQGKNLSGGQRQRIAIARALIRKPEVLILDESTSALDKATQYQVVENILEQFSEKIVIFVTHDPYIMQRVNEVVDLADLNEVTRNISQIKRH